MVDKYFRCTVSTTPDRVEMDIEDSSCITFRFYNGHTVHHCVYVHLEDIEKGEIDYKLMGGLIKGEKYNLIRVKKDT